MAMNPSIEALLDLQVIDQRRQTLRRARLGKQATLTAAQQALAAADAAAAEIDSQIASLGALVRQYETDVERCDAQIAELRSQQMGAKTNREYMAIINGIEQARLEKNHRDQSLRELKEKISKLDEKAQKARDEQAVKRKDLEEAQAIAADADKPSAEEADLQRQYDERKASVDPKFLEIYERLVKGGHKTPLVRVDPKSRSLPWGAVISQNQLEQIKSGKLVIASGTNQILYLG